MNALWAGLGYYRRAQMLLKGAKRVVEVFEGRIPSTVIELKKIDGIKLVFSIILNGILISYTECSHSVAPFLSQSGSQFPTLSSLSSSSSCFMSLSL